MSRSRIIILVLLLLQVGAILAAWWFITYQPEDVRAFMDRLLAERGLEAKIAPLSASGVIQATELKIAAEVAGQVERLHVRAGDQIAAGQTLVELDRALLEAQIAQAEAAIQVAQAGLALLQAGIAPEELARAQAEARAKEVERDVARQAWQDALTLRDNPQELDAQIAVLRAQLAAADHRLRQMALTQEAMSAGKEIAERALAYFQDNIPPVLPPDAAKAVEEKRQELWFRVGEASTAWWGAWVGLNSAQASRDGLQRKLEQLLAQREKPLALEARSNTAKAALDSAEAALRVAQRQAEALATGPSEEQIAVAQAQVAHAEAAREALRVQLGQMTLEAPRAGWITERFIHEGEMARPGAPLLTLTDLSTVTLTVYIPTHQIGRVRVGQTAKVTVDSFPGRVFRGQVAWIAQEAEFTPKNVQTHEERVNTLFAVEIQLPNADGALKPGMPADAVIEE